MQSVIISVAVGLLAFAMGLVGLYLKRRLPERHMSMGSRDVIGAIMGLLSLLLALVLGLLVGSAHQFFTSQKAELELLGARSLEFELAFHPPRIGAQRILRRAAPLVWRSFLRTTRDRQGLPSCAHQI